MKVKFLKNGMGIGLGYFAGDIAVIDDKRAMDAIELNFVEKYKTENTIDLTSNIPGYKQLIDANITNLDQLKQIPDLTEIKGIGKALAKKIVDHL